MKRGRKKKVIVPESLSQHIEDEFKKDKEFRQAYINEITRLKIAYKIMKLRKLKRLSQAGLAKRMKSTQQTISRLEDPKNTELTIATLSKVAVALGVKLSVELKT